MVATQTPPKTRKTARTLRVVQRMDREYIPAVLVTEGRATDAYCVFSFAGSVGWQHRADVRRSYTVTCSAGVPTGCTCDGWRFRGACRHVSGTAKLIEVGELDAPADADDRPAGWAEQTEWE